MLIKGVTTCIVDMNRVGSQMSKNDQDVWKLVVLCVSVPLHVLRVFGGLKR